MEMERAGGRLEGSSGDDENGSDGREELEFERGVERDDDDDEEMEEGGDEDANMAPSFTSMSASKTAAERDTSETDEKSVMAAARIRAGPRTSASVCAERRFVSRCTRRRPTSAKTASARRRL